MSELEFNPVANIFPLMQGAEYNQLKDDITANGLLDSIWLDTEGRILDGRNRCRVCLDVGVEPQYRTYEGSDELKFVISKNLHRRHLSESQRAVVASRLANMPAHRIDNKSANLPTSISQTQAASMLNVSERSLRTVKAIERDAPELIERIESGEITAHEAQKEIKLQQRTEARAEIAKVGASVMPDNRWHIYQGDIATWQAPRKYDFIITDPPYPKEYLPLWETLAKRASEWLKPSGLLIAMSGQSYLDEIYQLLSKHLEYYWTACYLTPGQPTPLRQVNVNTTWKPLLVYSNSKYTGKIFGDVFKSDGNDKSYHKWGQSESGMCDIISKICLEGQYILDPFCGAGTTGIASLRNKCLFDGLDIDGENVKISQGRIANDTEAD